MKRLLNVISVNFDTYKTAFNHTLWWLFYMFYELSSVYYSGANLNLFKYLCYYAINISVFYTQTIILNKTRSLTKARYLKLTAVVIIEFIIFLSIKLTADYFFINGQNPTLADVKQLAALDFNRSMFFAALATLYWTGSNISGFERKAKEAEIKQLTAARDNLVLEASLARSQNALLMQQINPHLLFNSLNFIHSIVYKVSVEAAENVILLADIMRFGIEETEPDGKIILKKEVEQLYNLIKINQVRFEQMSAVEFLVTGDTTGHRIIPLVLMTLTENVFKHGDLMEYPAEIKLDVDESGKLKFYTCNKIKAKAPYPRIKSTGLENIRIRLDYAYGNNYQLTIEEKEDLFQSELNIQL